MGSKVDLVVVAVVAIANAINALTEHWSKAKGLRKGLLFVTELLSVFASKGEGSKLKLPGKVK